MDFISIFLHMFSILSFVVTNARSSAIHRELEFLTSRVNSQYYGLNPAKDEYTIIHIEDRGVSRTRRAAPFTEEQFELSFKAFGEEYRLKLRENSALIPKGLFAEYLKSNGDVIKKKAVSRGCHYFGSVVSHEANGDSLSAISLCSGTSGFISTRQHNLYIHPLTQDHIREYKEELGHIDRQYTPHLVFRRSIDGEHDESNFFCGLDQKHYHLKNKSFIEGRNTDQPHSTGDSHATRRRREIADATYLEVMVTIDRDMAKFHGDSVGDYALALLNVAAARFQNNSLGDTPLFFEVVNVTVLTSDTVEGTDIHFNSDGEHTLTEFCRYQSGRNPTSDADRDHWDLAIFLTRKDLELNGSSSLLGLATAMGTCQPSRECLICEDYGLAAGLVLAHEVGHTLGMNHDGELDAQSCPEGQHLMSPFRIVGPGAFQWSQCSRSKFESFIRQFQCLNETQERTYEQPHEDPLAVSPDNQCRLYSVSTSSACTEAQLNEINKNLADTCGVLHCMENGVCTPTNIPSLDGTRCGAGMVCMKGTCEPDEQGIDSTSVEPSNVPIGPPPPINGGWTEWLPPLTPCTRTCGGGIQLQYRSCTDPAPINGGAMCHGSMQRVRLCNVQPCLTSQLEFKTEQCKATFGDNSIALTTQGVGDTLCQMNCFNRNLGTISSHGVYLNGTNCGDDYHVCVNGRCEAFGCNGIQGSTLSSDRCGIRCGDGTSCISVGYYTRSFTGGNVNVLSFARDTEDIFVKSTNPLTSIGIKVDNESIIEGQNQPIGATANITHSMDTIYYKENGGVETLRISGPTSVVFTLTVYVSDRSFVNSADYTSVVMYSYFGEPATLLNNYKWHFEEGTCNSCGSIAVNVVNCVWLERNAISDDSFCSSDPKPPTFRQCPCTYTWFYHNYQPCNATCGTDSYKTRTAVCVNDANPPMPVDSSLCPPSPHLIDKCNVPACITTYTWFYYNYQSCNATCGTDSYKTRTAVCVSETNPPTEVDASLCTQAPHLQEKCNVPACIITYTWFYHSYQSCNATCGTDSYRTRTAVCVSETNPPTEVDSSLCTQPPQLHEKCNVPACITTFTWFYHSYEPCNATCGTDSYKTRTAVCVSDSNPPTQVDSSLCPHPPHLHEKCNVPACNTYGWLLREWGQCSVTCGSGVQQRTIICYDLTTYLRVDDSLCGFRPPTEQQCSFPPCPCQPISCGPGSFFNDAACSCQVCSRLQCPVGQTYNADTCRCEVCSPLQCPVGQIYNADACRCENCPVLVCQAGQRFNRDICLCEVCSPLQCPDGQSYNADACGCETVCVKQQCTFGSNFNNETCECESDLDCGQYILSDPSTVGEEPLIQFDAVKGQLCSIALGSPDGYIIEMTFVVVLVDGNKNERFEVKTGADSYTWDAPLYFETRRFHSSVVVIDLLVKEEGHGYFITYRLIEDPGR